MNTYSLSDTRTSYTTPNGERDTYKAVRYLQAEFLNVSKEWYRNKCPYLFKKFMPHVLGFWSFRNVQKPLRNIIQDVLERCSDFYIHSLSLFFYRCLSEGRLVHATVISLASLHAKRSLEPFYSLIIQPIPQGCSESHGILYLPCLLCCLVSPRFGYLYQQIWHTVEIKIDG